jgi:hypothetical protein
MKQLLILLLALPLFANENLTKEINKIVDIISQTRQTISKQSIATLKDPFYNQAVVKTDSGTTVVTNKDATPSYEKVYFSLQAIINGKAKINNRWLQQGDIISEYVVEEIGANFAKLNYKKFYKKTLYLNQTNNNIINKR